MISPARLRNPVASAATVDAVTGYLRYVHIYIIILFYSNMHV